MKRIGPGAALLLFVTLWGCGSQPAPTTSSPQPSTPVTSTPPSADPSPSGPSAPDPSVAPTPAPSRAPRLTIDSIAKVVTNDLRIRSKPEVSDASKKLEPLLDAPALVYVVKGPVEASGYTWYEIAPIGNAEVTVELPFGWVAVADKDGTPWVAPASPSCPAKPTSIDDLVVLDRLLALACFGDEPIRINARLAQPEATCGVDIGWDVEPSWLGGTCPQPAFLVESTDSMGLSLNSVIDPDLDVRGFTPGVEEPEWLRVHLTGRFDHPDAKTCHGVGTGQPVPYPRDQIVVSCRATFVITKIVKA
ncbi:MAG TPA: hypothetical protein VFJ71_09745 [Candidatus Limnocylindrales bacterium]|nr:hypothetical protein [Candidatus Limnocylindrales bacterium]